MPPISVTLGKPEPVRAGELLQLACTAKDSNPKTTLTWYSQDNPIPDGAGKFFKILKNFSQIWVENLRMKFKSYF